ncbi:SOS response-associated peptidase [Sutcliffiella deserti]|uniref:SOS response-associated peptidase n=1 Tax=Sutcliffiella deserti TaxID=2875501 RepID=UPI001CC0E8EA|nr:SOS response-associated peptidase [Sutcliffiella deserti]
MCGRFSLTTELHKLEERFFIENIQSLDYEISYNVAPAQQVLSLVEGSTFGKKRAGFLQWGLIPSWSKDKRIGSKMINARAETLQEKVSFRNLLERRRCLIIADSFYEWKLVEGKKQPVRFVMKNGEPFAFAGLWDRWNKGEEEIVSCTVITTIPNSLVDKVHNRMPAILKKEHESMWIEQKQKDLSQLASLLTPFDENLMESYLVSSEINSPKNNYSSCIEPL